MNDEELLNWAMNQLYRAARTMQLRMRTENGETPIESLGCDMTANAILKRLATTKSGIEIIKLTNPKLLEE
jgi:hypothetical protein